MTDNYVNSVSESLANEVNCAKKAKLLFSENVQSPGKLYKDNRAHNRLSKLKTSTRFIILLKWYNYERL